MTTDYLSRNNIHRQIASDQRDLLERILAPNPADQRFDSRGLTVLRRNIEATASQALGITFPTVRLLIGESFFNQASNRFLRISPPSAGDWAEWGAGFADFLSRMPELNDYPYIAESAILDGHRHRIERSKNFTLETKSLGLLTQCSLDDIAVTLSDSVIVMRAEFPVLSVWQANHNEDKSHALSMYQQRVTSGHFSQNILLSRCDYKIKMREISDDEAAWFEYLGEGGSLGQGLAHLLRMGFTLETWLPWAMNNHLICGLRTEA